MWLKHIQNMKKKRSNVMNGESHKNENDELTTVLKPTTKHFYARKQLLLSARLSHRNSVRPSVCPSVRLSVTRVDQAKTVQARITKFLPSAARKTLVSGTVKLFHKFEGGHPERGP